MQKCGEWWKYEDVLLISGYTLQYLLRNYSRDAGTGGFEGCTAPRMQVQLVAAGTFSCKCMCKFTVVHTHESRCDRPSVA